MQLFNLIQYNASSARMLSTCLWGAPIIVLAYAWWTPCPGPRWLGISRGCVSITMTWRSLPSASCTSWACKIEQLWNHLLLQHVGIARYHFCEATSLPAEQQHESRSFASSDLCVPLLPLWVPAVCLSLSFSSFMLSCLKTCLLWKLCKYLAQSNERSEAVFLWAP